jgi:hypothetical protein
MQLRTAACNTVFAFDPYIINTFYTQRLHVLSKHCDAEFYDLL